MFCIDGMRKFYIFLFYTFVIIEFLHSLIIGRDKNEKSARKDQQSIPIKEKKKHLEYIRAVIKIVFYLCSIVTIILIVPKLAGSILYKAYMAISIVVMVFVLLFSFGGVFRFIFNKPFDFQLSKLTENSLYFVGLSFLFFSKEVSEFGNNLSIKFAHLPTYVFDLAIASSQVLWYFMFYFLSVTFLLLSLHKIIILKKVGKTKSKANKNKFETKRSEPKELANICEKYLDSKEIKSCILKVLVFLLWLICVIIDATVGFVIMFMHTIYAALRVIFIYSLNRAKKLIYYLFNNLSQNQGKNIIVLSRYVIVLALISVLFLDKYSTLLSEAGSEIFEFICSVLIIPIVISQLFEIRNYLDKRKIDTT